MHFNNIYIFRSYARNLKCFWGKTFCEAQCARLYANQTSEVSKNLRGLDRNASWFSVVQ